MPMYPSEDDPHEFGTSTWCTDSRATHQIVTCDDVGGYGIHGYYLSEFECHHVLRKLRSRGSTTGRIEPYEPKAPVHPGVHPALDAHLKGRGT